MGGRAQTSTVRTTPLAPNSSTAAAIRTAGGRRGFQPPRKPPQQPERSPARRMPRDRTFLKLKPSAPSIRSFIADGWESTNLDPPHDAARPELLHRSRAFESRREAGVSTPAQITRNDRKDRLRGASRAIVPFSNSSRVPHPSAALSRMGGRARTSTLRTMPLAPNSSTAAAPSKAGGRRGLQPPRKSPATTGKDRLRGASRAIVPFSNSSRVPHPSAALSRMGGRARTSTVRTMPLAPNSSTAAAPSKAGGRRGFQPPRKPPNNRKDRLRGASRAIVPFSNSSRVPHPSAALSRMGGRAQTSTVRTMPLARTPPPQPRIEAAGGRRGFQPPRKPPRTGKTACAASAARSSLSQNKPGAPSIRSFIADGWKSTNLDRPHDAARPELLPFGSRPSKAGGRWCFNPGIHPQRPERSPARRKPRDRTFLKLKPGAPSIRSFIASALVAGLLDHTSSQRVAPVYLA